MIEAGGQYHQPVMADEAVGYLVTCREGAYIDATSGGGSFTVLIASRLHSSGRVLAIDCDDEAVAETNRRAQQFSSQIQVMRGNFSNLKDLADKAGIAAVNGILFDLGVSSHQLDQAARGFTYRETGPLDLRLDRRHSLTAEEIVNTWPADKLSQIFFELGEEKNSRKIAAAIVAARGRNKIRTTTDLAAVVTSVTNSRWVNKTLSRIFQALRLYINDELGRLEKALAASLELLKPQGRLVVIAYHSLEDRIVKNFIRDQARSRPASPGEPGPAIPAALKMINKKPVVPSDEEIDRNPRARSARMRIAEKI